MACSASKQSSYLQNEKKETTQNPDDIIPDKRKQEDEIKQKSHPEKPEIVNDFHVAVLLPFSLNKDILPSSREYVVLESVTDYYQGILLALDDLKKFGIVITLHVYDTQKDSIHTAALLKKPEMASMDLIIGPLDPPCFQMINTFSKSYSIPIVAPFSLVNSQTPANPLAFYCSPDLESYGLAAGSYMSEHRKNARFFYLSDGSSTDKAFKKGLNVWKDSMGLKITERKIVPEMDVMPLLSKNDSITNYILLPSDNEKMVNLALRSFKPAEEEEYRLKVIGLDTWMDFRDPEMDHWDKMQACIITAWSENSEDSSFQKFNNTFREKFQIPPGKYALKGYDQMMFFGEALLAFGKGFPAYTRDTEFMGVGMDFTWHFTGRVIQNRALRLLHYYDYRFVYKP
ncbi:MAG: hypothetical protein GC180_00080 [Bacteroidetes bacterium]|nr:hypothetical protein [Bacteroidota bacterium]